MTSGPHPAGQARSLARLRHDLRTPIGVILGYAEMLLEDEDDLPDEAAEVLRRVLNAGRDLLDLVNRTFDEARFGREATQAGFEAKLRHALRTPTATVVGYAEMLGEDGTLPPQMADDAAQIADAGRRLVALLEGEGGLASAMEDVGGDLPEHPATTLDTTPLRGRVLVVDDNATNRDLLLRQLTRVGLKVETAPGGEEALALLPGADFDLVLLDVMMPGLSGPETLARLKGGELRDLPVIMISSLDDAGGVARCLLLGADDYLPKPFDPVVLRARVRSSLERKALRDVERAYLRGVGVLVAAAAAVEANTFEEAQVGEVAAREDELGRFARVFSRMAGEVRVREQRLQATVRDLRIEIDEVKRAHAVSEISETDYFKSLQERGRQMKRSRAQRAEGRAQGAEGGEPKAEG